MLFVGINLYAQDVIVKQDGSTIMAKVLEVETTVVKYKKWSNQDGPTYTIKKSELISINYANGEKDVFSVAKVEDESDFAEFFNTQKDIGKAINNSVSEAAYISSAGRGKIIGGALTFVLVGVPCLATGIAGFAVDASTTFSGIMLGLGVTGIGVGIGIIMQGKEEKRDAIRWSRASILQHDFKIGNYTLTPSIDVYNERMTKQKGIGAGLAFRF